MLKVKTVATNILLVTLKKSHVRPVKIAWVLEVSSNMFWRNYRHIDMFRSCEFFCWLVIFFVDVDDGEWERTSNV